MINEIITKVGNAIRDTLSGFFNLDWIPEIWFWYWWAFVIIMICGFVVFFFGWSKIVKMGASFVVLITVIAVAAGKFMETRLKKRDAKKQELEDQRAEESRERETKRSESGRWFNKW